MGLSHWIIIPFCTGSCVSRQMAPRMVMMAVILFNLSRHSLEATKGPPRALDNILEHRVRVGDRLRLTCSVESDPPSLVEWHKDGRPVHVGWERFRISRNHTLSISNFSSGDRGRYVCRATNGFGSVEIRHHVLLTWSPSLRNTEEPETYLAPSVGSSVRLLCHLPTTGSDGARITWYKDGVVLSSTFGSESDDVVNDASLTLKDVTLADSGVYECRDPDGANDNNITYVVDVIEDRNKPSFIEAPTNVVASFAGKATFFCHVRSDTVPHIQWMKRVEEEQEGDGKAVLNPGYVEGVRAIHIDQERFQVLSEARIVSRPDGSYASKLLIRNVRDEDAGVYLCTCTNNHGYIVSRAYLTIRTEAEDDVRDGLTSQHQDLPVLSLFAVLAVLALLVLFAILSYSIYRSRFGAKSITSSSSSSSAIVDGSRRWESLPVDHFRRCSSAALLATPEPGRDLEHRYAIVASTLDQQSSYWTPFVPVDRCFLRSHSPTLATTCSPTHMGMYSPTHMGMYTPTPETTYSPTTCSLTLGTRTTCSPTPESTYYSTPGTTSSTTAGTTCSPTAGTTCSPTPRTTYSMTSGSGYSDCAFAKITEVTSQLDGDRGRAQTTIHGTQLHDDPYRLIT